jgi:uncharacterized protein YfaP (DUF2135 family)
MKIKIIILVLFFTFTTSALFSQTINIDSPSGGFTTNRITEIKGRITGYNSNRCTLVINGIPQTIPVSGNRFNLTSIASPGLNKIEVIAGNVSSFVSFYAKVPSKDIKVLLTWDTPTDIDLWVTDPQGNRCYYSNRSTPLGGNLDTDVTTGYGPETFTMAKALPGTYAVQVQYYSSGNNPVTRVKVYVILYEGTSKEKRQFYEFAMTKEHAVYHITDFSIEEE